MGVIRLLVSNISGEEKKPVSREFRLVQGVAFPTVWEPMTKISTYSVAVAVVLSDHYPQTSSPNQKL